MGGATAQKMKGCVEICRLYLTKESKSFPQSQIFHFTRSGPESLLLFAGHSSRGDEGCCGGGLCWCSWSRRWWRDGRFHGPGLLFIILPGKLLRHSEGAHLSGGDWNSLLLPCRRGTPCYQSKREKRVAHDQKVKGWQMSSSNNNLNSFENNTVLDCRSHHRVADTVVPVCIAISWSCYITVMGASPVVE